MFIFRNKEYHVICHSCFLEGMYIQLLAWPTQPPLVKKIYFQLGMQDLVRCLLPLFPNPRKRSTSIFLGKGKVYNIGPTLLFLGEGSQWITHPQAKKSSPPNKNKLNLPCIAAELSMSLCSNRWNSASALATGSASNNSAKRHKPRWRAT